MNNRVCVAALTLLALLASGSTAWSQTAEWDQTRATHLAVELNEVVVDLQRSFRLEMGPSVASGQARARHRFNDSLRVMRTETRALASHLESGAGLEETRPIARRIGVVVRDLRQDGRQMLIAGPVASHIERAQAIIDQLAPFYVEPAS